MPEIKFRVQDSQGVWQYGHIGNYDNAAGKPMTLVVG